MDVFKAIALRHSYRGEFLKEAVSREDLREIVQAGIKAPSGKNEQTTQFIIIDDKVLLEKVGAMHAMKAMQTAAAIILCIYDRNADPIYEGYSFEVEDCAAAVENMLLAVTALGYATVWVDGWLRVEQRAEKIAEMINLPQEKVIKILLPIGVPLKKWDQKEKKEFSQRAFFNKWQ